MENNNVYDLSLRRKVKVLQAEADALRAAVVKTVAESAKFCASCGYDLKPKRGLYTYMFFGALCFFWVYGLITFFRDVF